MTRKALALVAVLLVVLSSAGVASAVTPGNTLADDFDSSTEDGKTVVVAIGDHSTKEGRASLTMANAIASEHNYSVVRVPNGSVPIDVIRTLGQQYRHGELENAIVVGVGQDNVDAVASAIDQIGDDDGTIAVKDQIAGSSPAQLLKQATLQTWSSSSAMLVTTMTKSDTAKASVAYSNDTFAGTPVLAETSGFSEVDSVGDTLGASTVYVTPGVSQEIRDKLSNNGYTVKTQVSGVTLDQSITQVSTGLVGNSTQDVAFVAQTRHVYTASQVGIGASSGLIVGEGGDTLSTPAETKFGNLGSLQDVYVLGDDKAVSDALISDISSATTSGNVSRVSVGDYTAAYLRQNLLVSGYNKGVLVSSVTTNSQNATVTITNIGYSTVQEVDGHSVAVKYDETDITTDPSGNVSDGYHVVEMSGAMDPMDTKSLTVSGGSLDKGGHPDQLDYYVSFAGGGFASAGDVLDTFFDKVNSLVDWIQENVLSVLPGNISLGASSILPLLVGVLALMAVVVGAVGYMRRRRG